MKAVLLHASASSGAQWRSLAAALSGRYRVEAPNLIGYAPGTAWPGARPLTLEDEAARVRELIGRDGPVDLVGHSYGGAVALHLARTSPALVRKLVLIEPVAFHVLRGGDASDAAGLREFASKADEVRNAFDPEAGARLFIDYWNGAGAWDRLPAERRAPVVAALPKLALEIEAVLGEAAGIAEMRQVRQPVLLLQGGLTQLSARCVSHRLARALPCVSFRVVRGAGHMLPLSHREAVNRLVSEHLDDPFTGGHWNDYAEIRNRRVRGIPRSVHEHVGAAAGAGAG
jgi:pimeloyl-ACP methyl ester carboxylesterase